MKRILIALALILFSSATPAFAQGTIQQSGPATPFHVPAWYSNGYVMDGGGLQSPYINSLSMFAGANCPFGVSSQTSPGVSTSLYSQFSICQTDATTTLSFQGVNGQAAPNVVFDIGGVLFPFPDTGAGQLNGTNTWTGSNTFTGSTVFSGSASFIGGFNAPLCTGSTIGLAPTGGSGSTFLRGDCTWHAAGFSTSVSLGTYSSGSHTILCDTGSQQYFTNGGSSTIVAPAADSNCLVMMTNNVSAGTITFSGFSVGSDTGAMLDTTDGHSFTLSIYRINGISGYRIAASQ